MIINWIKRQLKKPLKAIDTWRKAIPEDVLMEYVCDAMYLTTLTGEAKRDFVVKRIQKFAATRGVEIPTSVLNFLVEETLQKWFEKNNINKAPVKVSNIWSIK